MFNDISMSTRAPVHTQLKLHFNEHNSDAVPVGGRANRACGQQGTIVDGSVEYGRHAKL